jgi:outer membrane protein OmpA-like peptidoglycan-associated protein
VQVALDAAGGQNAQLEARKQQLETQQQQLEQQLASERDAREQAEATARAALASLEQIAQVKEEARETIITLSGSVLFETDKSELLPIARERLSAVAEALKQQGEGNRFVVEGHTDSRGADQYNLTLSQQRADAVRAFLVSQGMEASQIQAVGRGEQEPVAENETPEGRANNRRVEIIVQRPEGQAQPPSSTNPSP